MIGYLGFGLKKSIVQALGKYKITRYPASLGQALGFRVQGLGLNPKPYNPKPWA